MQTCPIKSINPAHPEPALLAEAVPSTVVDVSGPDIRILREGAIAKTDMLQTAAAAR